MTQGRSRLVRALQAALVGAVVFVMLGLTLVPTECRSLLSYPPRTTCTAFFGKSYSATGTRSAVVWPWWPLATSIAGTCLVAMATYIWLRRADSRIGR